MTETASAPSAAHCASSQASTSNGPSPQWCCHHRSTNPNGRLTAQSVAQQHHPDDHRAADPAEPHRRDRARQHAEASTTSATSVASVAAEPERLLAACEPRRAVELRALRRSDARRARRGGATARSCARAATHTPPSTPLRRLASRPCGSQSSPTSTPIFTHSTRCSRRSTPRTVDAALVPRRHRRLRTAPERVRRPRPRARVALALRQPRSRRARHARHGGVQRRCGRGGDLDAGRARRAAARRGSAGSSPSAQRRRRRAVPREPARSGVGVRAQRRAALESLARDDRAARARRAQPRRAGAVVERRTLHGGLAPADTVAELDGTLAAQPGLGRPAARRRPARRVGARSTPTRRGPSSGGCAYPIEQTQAEMRERGLPSALAARLAHGI